MQYIYSHQSHPSANIMATLLRRFIARWRRRKNKNKGQALMHSRWGDMSITAPTDGSWNHMPLETSPRILAREFSGGYTPELFVGGHGSCVPTEPTEGGRSRIKSILARFRLRIAEPEEPDPSIPIPRSKPHEAGSNRSASSNRNLPRVIYTPISREDLAIVNPADSARWGTGANTVSETLVEHSDEGSALSRTEIACTSRTNTIPDVISRTINQEEYGYHHRGYDGFVTPMDRMYHRSREMGRQRSGKGGTNTGPSPGLAATAFMRSSSARAKRGSGDTSGTKITSSSQSSSPGLAATAFMRSSPRINQGSSIHTAATSVDSSPIITVPPSQKKQKRQKKEEKKKWKARKAERVGTQELVPSYEELFG